MLIYLSQSLMHIGLSMLEVPHCTIHNVLTMTHHFSFCKGKESGHDVDLLISHPEEGKEEGLLEKILKNLDKEDLLEYIDIQKRSFSKVSNKQ